MILTKSFLTGVLCDCFKLIYVYLNEMNKVRECYSCSKMIVQEPFALNVHPYLQ